MSVHQYISKMGRSNVPSFFKVLIHDFSQELHLPADYIKNFNGEVPKRFILTNSTRRSWVVSDKKVDNDLLLSEEWPNFAKDNALEFGDLLVFISNGNSEFGVRIFGSNACEKEVELAMKNNAESNSNLKEEKEGKDMGNSDNLHSRVMLKCYKRRRTAEAAVTDKMTGFPNSVPIKTEKSQVEVGHSFTATFQPSRKYKIGIPNEIVKEKGLAEKDKMVLLDPCGRSWPVTVYCWKKGRTTLTDGWFDFCTANKLNANDTCHFQFIEGMGDAIKVEIFRTRLKTPVAKPASAGTKMSTDISKDVIEAPTRKRPREFVYDRVLHNSKQERCPEFEHVKESDKGEPRWKQHVSLSNRVIAAQEKHRFIAPAAFTSNNPFCSVTMQASYVGKNFTLVLPRAFAKKYMKHAPRGVTLRDSNDGTWHAQYRIGAQHTFIKGWKAFVFDNHLKECDVCIFELVDENPKHYVLKVTIIRH